MTVLVRPGDGSDLGVEQCRSFGFVAADISRDRLRDNLAGTVRRAPAPEPADTGFMISSELAVALRDAGLAWTPSAGDRFVIPQVDLDSTLFTLSEMTIEAREYPTGTILGFNGTTEWALDSVAKDDVLWMPREDQLRELLGDTFISLVDARADHLGGAYRVTVHADGTAREHEALSAADAYGLALLAQLQAAHRPA